MPWLEDLKFPRGYQMGTHKKLWEIKKTHQSVSLIDVLKYVYVSVQGL